MRQSFLIAPPGTGSTSQTSPILVDGASFTMVQLRRLSEWATPSVRGRRVSGLGITSLPRMTIMAQPPSVVGLGFLHLFVARLCLDHVAHRLLADVAGHLQEPRVRPHQCAHVHAQPVSLGLHVGRLGVRCVLVLLRRILVDASAPPVLGLANQLLGE
eukprot:7376400-Prymnesium_polylepis.2